MIYSAEELTLLSRVYIRATGIPITRLSLLCCGHNRLFTRLGQGYDCRTQAAEQASDWFDRYWPHEVPWPENVRRRISEYA